MKKTPLLNAALSEVVAGLGHGDMLVIADAGLPIPPQTRWIDLALTQGVPGFAETLRVVLAEMKVESFVVAEETGRVSPAVLVEIQRLMPGVPMKVVPHAALKDLTREARVVVRTGEFTPYANVILLSGVVF